MTAGRAIVVMAQKGGVGKTHIAKSLYDILPTRGRSVAAWDIDAETGTFAAYDAAIHTFDLNDKDNTSSWLDDCFRTDVGDVLIDVPGGHIDDVIDTFGDGGAEALVATVAESGRDLVVVTPIGVMLAETVTAQVALNAFAGTSARLVVVKNGRFGAADDFVIYDGIEEQGVRRYGATGTLARAVGAETVFLPALAPRLCARIDAERLRLSEAAGRLGIERLGRLNATRVQMYLKSVVDAFAGSSLDTDGNVPGRTVRS